MAENLIKYYTKGGISPSLCLDGVWYKHFSSGSLTRTEAHMTNGTRNSCPFRHFPAAAS